MSDVLLLELEEDIEEKEKTLLLLSKLRAVDSIYFYFYIHFYFLFNFLFYFSIFRT